MAIPSSGGEAIASAVGDVVEDAVDPAREREQVLGLDGGDERLPERAQQVALGEVALVLGIAHGLGRSRVAARPTRERVHAVDRDRHLAASIPSTSGVSGRNQRLRVTSPAATARAPRRRAPRTRAW